MRRPTGFDAPPRTLLLDRPGRPAEEAPRLADAPEERPGEEWPEHAAPPAPSPRELRARLRRAARERRRVEAAEVRRFTRTTRRRRQFFAGVAAAVVLLLGVPLGLAVSPAFAVRRVVVDGASPAVTAALQARLAGVLGTPLALVDETAVRRAVVAVPQVGAYRVASLPPGTLQVTVVQRTPVGQLRRGGSWVLVDGAGVVLATSASGLPGRPVLDLPAASGPRFAATVAVLRALPASVLASVASVSAPGADDVRLHLTSGLLVRWGDPDAAAQKGPALQAALKHVARHATVVDVSAPGLVTVR